MTAHSLRNHLHAPSRHVISPRLTDSIDEHIPLLCGIPRTTFLAQHQHYTSTTGIRHGKLAASHRSCRAQLGVIAYDSR